MRQGNIYSVTRRPLGRSFYWHSRGLRRDWIHVASANACTMSICELFERNCFWSL